MKTELQQIIKIHNQDVFYYLSENNLEDGTQIYGIMVTSGGDSVLCSELSLERSTVQSLLNIMIRGKVTAVTARDIIEDWLLR